MASHYFTQYLVRKGDSEEQQRQLLFLFVFYCFVCVVAVGRLLQLFVAPTDMSPVEFWVHAAVRMWAVATGIYCFIHLLTCGLTIGLKVLMAFFGFFFVAVNSLLSDPIETFHFWWVMLLDFNLMMVYTEREDVLFHRLNLIFLFVAVLYISVNVLSYNSVLPNIHPFENYDATRHLLTSILPLVVNYALVRYWTACARGDAQRVLKSSRLASQVAQHLANFDLDAAEGLLTQADDTAVTEPLSALLHNLRSYRPFLPEELFARKEQADPPNRTIAESMRGQSTSWERAHSAVRRLRDPGYTLREFDADVSAAFPELRLYEAGAGSSSGSDTFTGTSSTCTSGRSSEEELQRTMGALYSVYCLARLDLDGREIFTFGVDEGWDIAQGSQKQRSFLESMNWGELVQLMVRADLLYLGSAAELRVNNDRMMAFLVLTALHDVMKNPALLPTVQKRHSPYQGINEGTTIFDHDVALAYIMERFPGLLPSFQGLEPGQRAPIIFTQGKMGFNNGWLVQGEAPAGALFSTFKRVVVQGRASSSDIAFYFAHWITDLAGAEPQGERPWPGSEKFVQKFPRKVLVAFLESFAFVDRLAYRSEVEVMEEYLQGRWASLGLGARAGASIAAMRIALHAQGFEAEAIKELSRLPAADLSLLSTEMARTGHRDQYRASPAEARARPGGPAILVYYAPALLQKAGAPQVRGALLVLAAVYRAARQLFPLDFGPSAVDSAVVVRIEALKVLLPSEIIAVRDWRLVRTSPTEAEVVRGGREQGWCKAPAAALDLSGATSKHTRAAIWQVSSDEKVAHASGTLSLPFQVPGFCRPASERDVNVYSRE